MVAESSTRTALAAGNTRRSNVLFPAPGIPASTTTDSAGYANTPAATAVLVTAPPITALHDGDAQL
ncbi:hypothetical protein GCM10028799_18350 [Kribbella italica]